MYSFCFRLLKAGEFKGLVKIYSYGEEAAKAKIDAILKPEWQAICCEVYEIDDIAELLDE